MLQHLESNYPEKKNESVFISKKNVVLNKLTMIQKMKVLILAKFQTSIP